MWEELIEIGSRWDAARRLSISKIEIRKSANQMSDMVLIPVGGYKRRRFTLSLN